MPLRSRSTGVVSVARIRSVLAGTTEFVCGQAVVGREHRCLKRRHKQACAPSAAGVLSVHRSTADLHAERQHQKARPDSINTRLCACSGAAPQPCPQIDARMSNSQVGSSLIAGEPDRNNCVRWRRHVVACDTITRTAAGPYGRRVLQPGIRASGLSSRLHRSLNAAAANAVIPRRTSQDRLRAGLSVGRWPDARARQHSGTCNVSPDRGARPLNIAKSSRKMAFRLKVK